MASLPLNQTIFTSLPLTSLLPSHRSRTPIPTLPPQNPCLLFEDPLCSGPYFSHHISLSPPLFFFFEAGRVVFFWLYHTKCRILAPWSGIELVPPAVEAQSPNHWTTREVPPHLFHASAILNHSRFFQTTGASSHGGHCSSWFSTLDMSALQVCVNTHAVFPAFSTVWWDAPSAGSFSTIHLIPPFHSVYHNTTACSLACASLQTVGSLKPLADYFLCCI